MGKVFSPEEIDEGRFPEPGAHEEAGRFVLKNLFDSDELWVPIGDGRRSLNFDVSHKYHGLESGMIYGSTALGTANIRSDVDALVVYRGESSIVLSTIREVFEEAEKTYHVPVEGHILEFYSRARPLGHSIDSLFLNHLLAIQEQDEPRWSYNWPVSYLLNHISDEPPSQQSIRNLAEGYTSGKMRQFARAITGFRGEINYNTMQRALELPSAIGRKVIAATIDPDDAQRPHTMPAEDSMPLMMQKLYEIDYFQLGPDTAKNLRMLSTMNQEYNNLLDSAVNETIGLDYYTEWLQRHYLTFCRMAHDLAFGWKQIIGDNRDRPMHTVVQVHQPSNNESPQGTLFDDLFDDDIY